MHYAAYEAATCHHSTHCKQAFEQKVYRWEIDEVVHMMEGHVERLKWEDHARLALLSSDAAAP